MPRSQPFSGWTVAAIVSLALAILFVLTGGISSGFSGRTVTMLGLSGAMIGAISAPELEPRAFRFPAAWQMSCGVVGCVLIALYFHADRTGYGLAVVGGALLGFTGPWWVKHVQLP
jgi:hypothetical protein